MINYLYLSSERIQSIYNQLVADTPVEQIREKLNKKGILTDWKCRLEAGWISIIKGEASRSRSKTEEETFVESIRSTVELEQKIDLIERRINFVNVEDLVAQKILLTGQAVRLYGSYYSKGLKEPNYYSSTNWDGTLPFLYRNVGSQKIKVVYSPLHLISMTSWAIVRGRLRIDGIGFVATIDDNEVVIAPIAFGTSISDISRQVFGE